LLLFVAVSSGAKGASAQSSDGSASADHTAPSYDMKAQSLADLQAVQKKFVDLANAIPADKFTWRPSSDSRFFCGSISPRGRRALRNFRAYGSDGSGRIRPQDF
jgi:hypothetical protein